jgi:hypothetical protein
MDSLRQEPHSSSNVPRGPVDAIYSADGVDLTLIRWMLSLTPAERLQVLQLSVRSLARLCIEASFTCTLEEKSKL